MALKSKPPSLGASGSGPGKKTLRTAASVETIEARLERKATLADTKTFATTSLGQMTREKRHKLLYGD
jgi:hypothetical protein